MSPLFDYDLPTHLIAQLPAPERDSSRLMVLHRSNRTIETRVFRDLPDLLKPNDLLVLNDTRVVPARLIGHRAKTGGKWEGLFLREAASGQWEMLAQTKGKPSPGEAFDVDPGPFQLIFHGQSNRHWFMEPRPAGKVPDLLKQHGRMPLPPYIRKGLESEFDRVRYQTVFAETDGSIAAPTAGLHFTPSLLEQLRTKGIESTRVTLHVGLGTFEPIRAEDPLKHEMHSEWADVSQETVDAIHRCKANGGRIIAVGTTATRALESAASDGVLRAWTGETRLFIYPPYQFKVIDGLITNFHLPRTTLLLLVGALAGMGFLEEAYRAAIEMQYRFYSYGDAMLIT